MAVYSSSQCSRLALSATQRIWRCDNKNNVVSENLGLISIMGFSPTPRLKNFRPITWLYCNFCHQPFGQFAVSEVDGKFSDAQARTRLFHNLEFPIFDDLYDRVIDGFAVFVEREVA